MIEIKNVQLIVTIIEMSEDHQSQMGSSSGDQE